MKATVFVESGVPDVVIGAANYAIHTLGENLPPQLGGLAINVERGAHFPVQSSGKIDARFIEYAPAWGDESFNLFVTGRPLLVDGDRVGGYAVPGQGIAIASTAEFDRAKPHEPLEFLAVALHESAHAFGLVNERSPQFNPATGHCRNTCIMQDGAEKAAIEFTRRAFDIRRRRLGGFCVDCHNDLQRLRIAP